MGVRSQHQARLADLRAAGPGGGVGVPYDAGAVGFRLDNGDGGFQTREIWRNKEMRNHFNSSVLVDGMIYGFDNATLKAVDPQTGDKTWAYRRGLGKGSLIFADGLLIVLTETGTLKLVEGTARQLCRAGLAYRAERSLLTEPTLLDGRLYLRNREEMVALDLRSGRRSGSVGVPKPSAVAEGSGQPTGKLDLAQVLERHVAARGGRERLAALQSLRLRGTQERNGDVRPFTMSFRAPGSFRVEAESSRGPQSWCPTAGRSGRPPAPASSRSSTSVSVGSSSKPWASS